jgi:purine-binding chemotaxis protein CheW
MSDGAGKPSRAHALRAAFDAAFAAPARAPRRDEIALLALRVGTEPFAMRVLEAAGILAGRPLAAVPSRRPELLGVAGLRGNVVPVYSVARLVGRAVDEAEAPRFLVLAAVGADERVALAFSGFDGHLRVPPAALAAASDGARAHVRELVQLGAEARPVLSVPSLLKAITGR